MFSFFDPKTFFRIFRLLSLPLENIVWVKRIPVLKRALKEQIFFEKKVPFNTQKK
jgi:hypothetical protein